jgi:hypothetical protein
MGMGTTDYYKLIHEDFWFEILKSTILKTIRQHLFFISVFHALHKK